MNNPFPRRFAELESQANELLTLAVPRPNEHTGGYSNIPDGAMLKWKTSVKHLISQTCGTDSQHLAEFTFEASTKTVSTLRLERLRGIFDAAREDYLNGYIVSNRELVQAEVFASELEQAKELTAKGYSVAAAVIAGTVLETHLRALCSRAGLAEGKIESMNVALVKAGVYNVLRQKQITTLADLRNKAAHGKVDDFSIADVSSMLVEVERIVASPSSTK